MLSIICPKNTTDNPMCKEMLAYGKIVNMADQGHVSEDEIEALDEQHQKKINKRAHKRASERWVLK